MKVKVKGINGIYAEYSLKEFIKLLKWHEKNGNNYIIDEWGVEFKEKVKGRCRHAPENVEVCEFCELRFDCDVEVL